MSTTVLRLYCEMDIRFDWIIGVPNYYTTQLRHYLKVDTGIDVLMSMPLKTFLYQVHRSLMY